MVRSTTVTEEEKIMDSNPDVIRAEKILFNPLVTGGTFFRILS
jgi:hypothetical protein